MNDKYGYYFEYDKRYCYTKTNVLINKLGIQDAEKLKIAERQITALKIANAKVNKIVGKYDFQHLKNIHKYIFEDIYDWAGEVRWVNIAKGNMFCHYEFILSNADALFQKLKNENFLNNVSNENMPIRLVYYFSEINVIHPFREGNGRAQRLFIEYLAEKNGYVVDFTNITKQEMIQASAEAFACQYNKMNEIFYRILKKVNN